MNSLRHDPMKEEHYQVHSGARRSHSPSWVYGFENLDWNKTSPSRLSCLKTCTQRGMCPIRQRFFNQPDAINFVIRTPTMAHWPLKKPASDKKNIPQRRNFTPVGRWWGACQDHAPDPRLASIRAFRRGVWLPRFVRGVQFGTRLSTRTGHQLLNQAGETDFSRQDLNHLSLNWEVPSLPKYL